MNGELANIAAIISSVLTMIIALETKSVYKFFKEKKAFSSESAVEFEKVNFFKKKILKRLLKSGEVVKKDKKYYLNFELHKSLKERRQKRIKIILPIVIVAVIILILFVVWKLVMLNFRYSYSIEKQ